MSFSSFFSKEKEEVSLLIDIGNGSVTGALAVFQKSKKPVFLYATEQPLAIRETPNASKLVDDMLALLESLIADVMVQGLKAPYWKNNPKNISGALLTFSSPWFVSKTKHIELSKEGYFVITKAFIDDIIAKEEELFKKELSTNSGDSFQLIEKSIVHTKINGYTLDTSIGKKTKSLDAYLYMSVLSSGVVDKVESIIQKSVHVPKNKIMVHTFPLVSFTVIRDIFSGSSDFMIMDITGEVTDITLVQNDVIKQSVSVPSGRNFLVRQIMKTFGVTAEIAESTLHLYTSEKLDEEDVVKMDAVLTNVEKEWSIYFENGLSELSPQMVLPGTLYLTADDDVAPLYLNFLKLSKTDSTAMFRKAMSVHHLSAEVTSSLYGKNQPTQVNEFIAILAMFYNKLISR